MKRFIIDFLVIMVFLMLSNQMHNNQDSIQNELNQFELKISQNQVIRQPNKEVDNKANQLAKQSGEIVKQAVVSTLNGFYEVYDLLIHGQQP